MRVNYTAAAYTRIHISWNWLGFGVGYSLSLIAIAQHPNWIWTVWKMRLCADAMWCIRSFAFAQSTYTSYIAAILNWISLRPVTAKSQSAVVLCHTYDYLQIFCQLNESKLWTSLTFNYSFWVNCKMGKVCHLRSCSGSDAFVCVCMKLC